MQGEEFRVQGQGLGMQGEEFRVQGQGLGMQGKEFRVQGQGFKLCKSTCVQTHMCANAHVCKRTCV